MMIKKILPALAALLLLGASTPLFASKIDFWNVQRKGANWFNFKPTREWLVAAKAAGIQVVRLAPDKWQSEKRDFLIGNADRYEGIVEKDFQKLKQVLDQADTIGVKIVLTMLSLPGARWKQNNGDKLDLRLWRGTSYLSQVCLFWKEMAARLKNHPALVGYNILNEPVPERTAKPGEEPGAGFSKWYATAENTPADLNRFNARVLESIRQADKETPVILDCGWWASPLVISYLNPLIDDKVIYSVHMYEVYEFTSQQKINAGAGYPGKIFRWQNNKKVALILDRAKLEEIMSPVAEWQKKHGIPSSRIWVSEFGCRRKARGAANYLGDLIQIFNQHNWHWAFYSFREDGWDAMDYEMGTAPAGEAYWQAVEHKETPVPRRMDNPIWGVIKSELKK